jgi:uncharacterized protein YegL
MPPENTDYGLGEVQAQVKRVPNLFLLDTSGSMKMETEDPDGNRRQKIDLLNEGLEWFSEDIGDDFETREGVDVSVITFGGGVSVEQEFRPVKEWVEGEGPPLLSAGGQTPMCEAITRGLTNLNEYKSEVDNNNLGRHRAMVWLLTDGRPDQTSGNDWDAAQQSVEAFTQNDSIFFWGVGIGDDADTDTLRNLVAGCPGPATDVFNLGRGRFNEFFKRASASATGASKGRGEESASEFSEEFSEEYL